MSIFHHQFQMGHQLPRKYGLYRTATIPAKPRQGIIHLGSRALFQDRRDRCYRSFTTRNLRLGKAKLPDSRIIVLSAGDCV